MSTLLSSQPLSGRSPVEALLLVYLTTVPAWRASRILETWDSGTQLTTFAETILNNIPLEFFESTLPVPNGPRYVIDNGALSLQLQPSHNLPAIDREYLRALVRAWRPNHVQAERPPVRTNSLNSFMVFRNFVGPLFPKVPQMQRSITIAEMWNTDPFKTHWAVLAQAYTILRDHFLLNDRSLRNFIGLVSPLCNLPTADVYAQNAGWYIVKEDDHYALVNMGGVLLDSTVLNAVSAEELVQFSRTIPGYATLRPGSTYREGGNLGSLALERDGSWHHNDQDPLNWLMNSRGDIQDGTNMEFTADDLYPGGNDGSLANDDLVYVPQIEQDAIADNEAEAIETNGLFDPDFPHTEPFEHPD